MVPNIVADGRVYGVTQESIVAYVHDGEALTERWRTPFSGPHKSGISVLAEGTLYRQEQGDLLASPDGPVHRGNDYLETYSLDGERLDRERWGENRTISGLVVADGVEYLLIEEFDPDGGYVSAHLLARDPEERWRRTFPAPATRPVVAGDTVVVSDGEKTLLAFDTASGERLWEVEGVGGECAVVEDTIYVAGDEFYALHAD